MTDNTKIDPFAAIAAFKAALPNIPGVTYGFEKLDCDWRLAVGVYIVNAQNGTLPRNAVAVDSIVQIPYACSQLSAWIAQHVPVEVKLWLRSPQ